MKTNLQIPIDSTLRVSAEKVALSAGYSSLQDVVRVFLTKFAKQEVKLVFVNQEPDEYLTSAQEMQLTKKFQVAKKDKSVPTESINEMMSDLLS